MMNESKNPSDEQVTADVVLSGPDWELRTKVSVTKGPMQPRALLPMLQSFADAVVAAAAKVVEEKGQKISCKKGCGACCRQLVPIAETEARHMRDVIDALPEPRQAELRGRFASARRRLEATGLLRKLMDRHNWRGEEVQPLGIQYFLQGIPCPFLEEESCSIYANRPIACREYLVTSPAENCAQPSKENIQQVALPFRIWPGLARLETSASPERFVRWVPLILAPEWAEAHPEEAPPRPGPELLKELLDHLTETGRSMAQDGEPLPANPVPTRPNKTPSDNSHRTSG